MFSASTTRKIKISRIFPPPLVISPLPSPGRKRPTSMYRFKYAYQYGPLHAAGIYSVAARIPVTLFRLASAGGAYRPFSIDGVYQRVNARAQASADDGSGLNLNAAPAAAQYSSTLVKAIVTDSEFCSVQGKYTFEFGGYKDGDNKQSHRRIEADRLWRFG